MNRPCDRLPIAFVTRIDTGTVINAITASTGEITIIIVTTPMHGQHAT